VAFRRFLARVYVAGWLFRVKAIVGQLCLAFYRIIYPDFSIGRKVWGRFEMMMMTGGTIEIGDNFHVVSSPSRSTITLFSRFSLTTFDTGRIRIGNNVSLNGTAITSKKGIEIGDGTMVAANVTIVDSDFHAQWPPNARLAVSTGEADREVVIGRNVWIGLNVVILKGVTIGDNTIIGAGSVVTSPIPANVVAAGNPARVVRDLHVAEERHP